MHNITLYIICWLCISVSISMSINVLLYINVMLAVLNTLQEEGQKHSVKIFFEILRNTNSPVQRNRSKDLQCFLILDDSF